jgi:N-carbamoyl-L-amino-acid hydrolase
MVDELMEKAPKLCEEIGVEFPAEIVGQFDPPAFDEGCVGAVREAPQNVWLQPYGYRVGRGA